MTAKSKQPTLVFGVFMQQNRDFKDLSKNDCTRMDVGHDEKSELPPSAMKISRVGSLQRCPS